MKDVVWALVMSSTQARIIKGIAKGTRDEMPELALQAEQKALREIMSDMPGRSFSSVGSARSAMEYASDPVKDAKKAFVDETVALPHQHFAKKDFTHLAILAAPEMLGHLRGGLPPDLQHAVIVEMPKNLLHETPHALGRLVTDQVFTKG
jgi:protein required for attachment to host cells